MKLGRIAFRNIFRNFRRSLLSASAIGVAALSIVLLYSLLEGMTEDLKYNQQTYSTGAVRIRNEAFTKNERLNPLHLSVAEPDRFISLINNIPGVQGVSPRINFPTRIYKDEENFNAMGTGIDFTGEPQFQDLGPDIVQEGRLPETGKNEVLMGYKLAEKVGVGVGDKITILSSTATRGTNAITFMITGLAVFPLSSLNEGSFYAPLDRIQYFLRMNNQVQEILIKNKPGTDPVTLAASLRSELGDSSKLEILDWMSVSTTFSMMEMASTMYDIFALFFFILGCSVILNTTIMVIFERMKEIGTLSAMGMSGGDLIRLFFFESLYIAMIGSFLGVLLGIIITQILSMTGINLGSAMEGVDFDISTVIYPKLSLKSTLFVFLYSVAVASITSIFPSRRASRIEPVEALRGI
jgi:putative ABC transport system permease protein